MNFWLIAIGFTLLATLICFYPLLSKKHKDEKQAQLKRDKLNKAFYFDRLKELEQDEQQGLLENSQQLKTELQQTLLEDIPQQESAPALHGKSYGKIWFISAFISLIILSTLAYMKVGSWQTEAMLEKSYEKLPHFYARLNDEKNPLSDSELQQFLTALRLEAQKSPKNAESWGKLARVAIAVDNIDLAFESYKKAHELDRNNMEYALGYAKILIFSDNPVEQQSGEQILKVILAKDHTNFDALSALAFSFFQKENYTMAISTWSFMLKLLPADDPRIALLEKSINAARNAKLLQSEEQNQPAAQ